MGKATSHARGFTLIATLLLLVLLSGVAVGLMYLTTGAGRVGSNDLESNVAYYGAEAAMEKLTGDVLNLYQQKMSPVQSDLDAVAQSSPPNGALVGGMSFSEKVFFPTGTTPGTSVLSSGPYTGLTAETVPITLQVSAMRPFGAAVNMTRGVEVALIPVFQFGVFSDSDLSYFPGPQFGFQGRVHTNGNLFLAADSGPLIIDAKITAGREIIRDRLANNFNNGNSYQGSVFVPNTLGGCDNKLSGGALGTTCVDFGLDANETATDFASWSGGIPPNGATNNTSYSNFNGMVTNNVTPLLLPFVQGAALNNSAQQIQIIRKPPAGETATSPLAASREYNKATIRILLADTQADLHPDRPGVLDADDLDLTAGGAAAGLAINVTGLANPTRFAMAATAKDAKWVAPPTGVALNANNAWNLVNGWLRVEYLDKTTGAWVGATREWLGYGFARGTKPPSVPVTTGGANSNTIHPDAILIFQQLADRNADGNITGADAPSNVIDGGTPATYSQYSWYPINLFDPREGFPRDFTTGNVGNYNPALAGSQCYVNGIMNAVELDVGNLRQWLKGNAPFNAGNGKNVNFTNQNGYLLYFSDRRGMVANPNQGNITTGEYGFEDVINAASATGTPDGALEGNTPGYNANNGFSPEDVDENGLLDVWGAANVGNSWGLNTVGNPFKVVDCLNGGRQNIVTGARHALKLVDGGWGNLPTRQDNNGGGFSVAAENPVYVQGNYNTDGVNDPFWNTPTGTAPAPAAAGIIADAVTLLSNGWSDLASMANPLTSSNATGLNNRDAQETYYRMAIAAGKNMNFPYRNTFPGADFGTDAGVHNFLRYVEDWSPAGGCCTLHYRGSLVSLYYSQYATGVFKCCNQVYNPPTRDYYFDSAFLTPANLPPGTPMMQDIENLSYWQNFNPCSQQAYGKCTN
jgi:PilX N-terminal